MKATSVNYFRFSGYIFFLFVIAAGFSSGNGLNDDVLKYTNQFRKSKKMSGLIMRSDLNAIAQKHSDDMAKGRRRFGHGGMSQREQQVKKIFSPYGGMAENVAYGPKSGKEAVTMWQNSTIHRKNLLGTYKYIGIGTARDRRGVIYYTQIFVR